ncbi:MAG: hypothetical protein LBV30_03110 [Propionibacteriaceae bacterium]|jgi:antitoxin (DNA-binding transcriptional repressor) of toxin-antitoxin stability system|nr:hypothetical protein [Propionibacteriaceae bacterium]
MTTAVSPPIVLSATEASRSFAAVIERAHHGETFIVEKGGQPMAQITPSSAPANGALVRDFLDDWSPDPVGFTPAVLIAMESLDQPQARDEERLKWAADSF